MRLIRSSALAVLGLVLLTSSGFSSQIYFGKDEEGAECWINVLETDDELLTAREEDYGSYRFGRYARVQSNFSEQEIWIGPEKSWNDDPSATSNWKHDFNKLDGEVWEDRLIDHAIIGDEIDVYRILYFVEDSYFVFKHELIKESDEDRRVLLEQSVCFLSY